MRSSGVLGGTAVPWFLSRSRLLRAISGVLCLTACRDAPLPMHTPTALRFGVFAADAGGPPEQVAARFQPLKAHLEARLKRPIALVASNDAAAILAQFEAGRFDVAFHRAITFPHAQEHVGAVPVVTRQEDRHTTTVFLASATDPRQSLEEFRGARFTFSVRLGSSYVMGRHYLEQHQIDLESFFRDVHYSAVADEALSRLRSGQADLCVASSQAMARMLASGSLRSSEIKIVAETPPHVGELWFASTSLPADLRMQVRDAFLVLSPERPEHAAALRALSASAYLPATSDDYRQLTDLMRRMRLLDLHASEFR